MSKTRSVCEWHRGIWTTSWGVFYSIEIITENVEFYNFVDYDKNSKYRDPLELGAYIRGKCKEKDIYHVFIDEIQKVCLFLLFKTDIVEDKYCSIEPEGDGSS